MHASAEHRKRTAPESPRHDELRAYLLQLCAELLPSPYPPADVIGRFLRQHPSVKGSPGRFLAASASAMMRARVRTLTLWQWADRKEPLFDWPEPMAPPAALSPHAEAAVAMVRWLREECDSTPEDALRLTDSALAIAGREGPFSEPAVRAAAADWIARRERDPYLENAPDIVRASARWSVPRDLAERWTARFGDEGARDLFASLGRPAPLDLRANTLRTKRRDLLALLRESAVAARECPWSKDGVRLAHKANLKNHPLFREGFFEIQDEGSQLVSLALSPQPGWRVLDACAGGGGKTLHLAAMMSNKGEVFANDATPERLDGLRARLGKSGASCIRMIEPGTAAAHGPYDGVLIDAPCLGFGTLRRAPELFWRGPLQARIAETTALQRECVRTYAPLVRPGGVLVYAVCSFEPEETTDILRDMRSLGFRPDRLSDAPFFPKNLVRGHDATVLPSTHETDGFYMARFVKEE